MHALQAHNKKFSLKATITWYIFPENGYQQAYTYTRQTNSVCPFFILEHSSTVSTSTSKIDI